MNCYQDPQTVQMFYIKVKCADEKKFWFLTPNSGSTYKKIHAVRVAGLEKAERLVAEIIRENPGTEAKFVAIK